MCDHFVRKLSKIFIAQVCHELGYSSIQESAWETLADVLQRYIEEIGFKSRFYAELNGRTECNFLDVKKSFDDLQCSLRDLFTFATNNEETPFAKGVVPAFPVKKTKVDTSMKAEKKNTPDHIPPHLPPFPEEHTYKFTPIFGKKVSDDKTLKKVQNKQRREVENSLAKLHEKVTDFKKKAASESQTGLNPDDSTSIAGNAIFFFFSFVWKKKKRYKPVFIYSQSLQHQLKKTILIINLLFKIDLSKRNMKKVAKFIQKLKILKERKKENELSNYLIRIITKKI